MNSVQESVSSNISTFRESPSTETNLNHECISTEAGSIGVNFMPTSPDKKLGEVTVFQKTKCLAEAPVSNQTEGNIVSLNKELRFSKPSTETTEEASVSRSAERRFILVGSTIDRSNEVRPPLKLKKQVVCLQKPYLSKQYSSSKLSPCKSSPSRRTSILQPLVASPAAADNVERKYFEHSSSPRRFSGDLPSLLNPPFSNRSCLEDRLKRRSIEEEEEKVVTKKLKPGPVAIEKKRRKLKSPFINLKKFQKKGRNQDTPNPPDEYEVEYIEAHKILEDNECMFYVKWIGWDSCDNTWEPITNLLNCQEKLVSYFEKLIKSKKLAELEILQTNATLKGLRETLSQSSDDELNALLATYRSASGVKLPVPNKEFIEKTLHLLSKQVSNEVSGSLKERLQHELLLEKLCARRRAQLVSLQEWELEINFLAQNSAPITVENNFDLEGPPPNFNYINHYLPGAGVIIPHDPPVGCDCAGGCTESSKLCCGKESGFAYDQHGRIKVKHGTPIYECNNRCTCPVKCRNRVIQRGQHYRLCIFKTHNGCGWGVKALQDIKKGSFITKYVGEVITADEAAIRSNTDSKFYLFDLDFNCEDNSVCPFTVDASVYGNISHFINHSCDPNLAIFAAWINCLDPNIPLLVLFAIKDIRKGDELCFSYSRTDTDTSKTRKGEVKCNCKAPNCRKYVF